MNLDFAKVCGKHSAIYEAYYKQIDPKGSGAIEALTAAKFLKKSGLSDVVLSRVWDLSDPGGKGFLDKPGFFVALKLVSLAQAGQVVNMSNIYMDMKQPPKLGDLPKVMPPRIQTVPVSSGGVANGDWSIGVIDRLKYEQLFESLKPVNGMLPGNKVKGVLMDSKLPMETLGKIWDLADQDKDGNLDKHEFLVAMHLVYQTLEKRTVPNVLPPELRKGGVGGAPPPPKPAPPVAGAAMPRAPSGDGFSDAGFVANFPKDIAPPPPPPTIPPPMTRVPPIGAGAPSPLISTDPLIPIGAPPSVTANADWVVTPDDLKRFEVMFRDSDRDKDGLVSGLEVKGVFLQSGVPQNCLAHIWALCDTNQSGKLTLEQFALAMWMVERKKRGLEPPQVLTANMVPPSMRATVAGVDLQPQAEPKPTYSNPELEMISKEIEELAKERRSLENEIAQKEADIRIKSGEVRSLQSELDTLSATLKQLENQRGEAQKRLDDLKAQVSKIRDQCQKQEDTINEQEGELNAKRSELQKLKDEEAALQKEYDENNRELTKLTQHLQSTQLQISSVRSMVTQLLETQRQMTDALLMCRAAIENQDGDLVTEYQLKIEPDFDEAKQTLAKRIDEPKDPFEEAPKASVGFTSNGFGSSGATTTADPFVGRTSGFDDGFNTSSGFESGFDAFGGGGFNQQQLKDPFGSDAFGANRSSAVTPEPGKDDFGSDPFAALHAPTGQGQVLSPNAPAKSGGPPPRPESPSPALPPKKSKVPPPRPAPPRPIQAPARPGQPTMDGFGSSGGGGFADFADFDDKLSNIPTTLATTTTQSPTFALLSSASSLFDDITSATAKATTITTTATTTAAANAFASFPNNPTTFTPIHTSTSSALAFTAITTNTTTTTTTTTLNNDHFGHAPAPLQQAASSVFAARPTTTEAAVPTAGGRKGSAAVISGPTDFSDDPFKDYRYEDPFSIKDPFADDVIENPANIFKDDLSSDDDENKDKKDGQATLPSFEATFAVPALPRPPPAAHKLSNEFLDKFDAFSLLNPSPVPSHKSNSSTGRVVRASSNASNSERGESHSNSSTPTPVVASAFDDFADFDAFSTKSSGGGGLNNHTKTTTTIKNNVSNNKNNNKSNNIGEEKKATNDAFFDAFNDNFDVNSNVGKGKDIFDSFGAKSKFVDSFVAQQPKVDPFAAFATTINTTKASTKIPDQAFASDFGDDSFGDSFFDAGRPASPNNNSNNNKINNKSQNNIAPPSSLNANFAKFDDFDLGEDCTDSFSASLKTALNNSVNVAPEAEGATSLKTIKNLMKPLNVTSLSSKIPNAKASENVGGGGGGGGKLPTKFADDYSNADSFDVDLEEALKRSMVDQ